MGRHHESSVELGVPRVKVEFTRNIEDFKIIAITRHHRDRKYELAHLLYKPSYLESAHELMESPFGAKWRRVGTMTQLLVFSSEVSEGEIIFNRRTHLKDEEYKIEVIEVHGKTS